MFAKLYSSIGFGTGAAPAAVRLPESHQTQLQFNDGSLFLLTRLSPVLVRTYYEKAAARNAATTDAGAIEMQKDFTNAARPITAAAMQLVMDLLSALETPSQRTPTPPVKDVATATTTTLTIFAPSDPPFVPLQSRALYDGVATPRLIDAAYLARELELEAPFEGLTAELGRRVHALLTLGGISSTRRRNGGAMSSASFEAPRVEHQPKDGKTVIRLSIGASELTQTTFAAAGAAACGTPSAAATTHVLNANESILHVVARADVTVSASTAAPLTAGIASSLCDQVGLPDWTKDAAAPERLADLAVLFDVREAHLTPSVRNDEPALRRLLRRRWQPDAEVVQCKSCRSHFFGITTTLRSHCRRCGDIYCKKCLSVYSTDAAFAGLEKPGGGDSPPPHGPRKICRACHEIVGEGTVARFYMQLIEGMGLSVLDVRALMLLDSTWEAAAVEVLWQYRKETYLMGQCVAHDAVVLSSVGVAAGHPELVLRILAVEAVWSLPPDHPIVKQMLATVHSSFKSPLSAPVVGCGLLFCTRACERTRADMGTFAIRVLRAVAHRDSAPHAAVVRAMALRALYKVMNDKAQRDVARLSTDVWLHALLDMYFSADTCQRARGDNIVAVSEGELAADRSKLETRLNTLLDAIVYVAVRSDAMRMKVVCEIVYRHSSRDTAVRGWCSTLDASLMIARSNFEIVHRVRERAAAPPSCFSNVQGIGTFQTVLMTLQQCAMTAVFETVEAARACLYAQFPAAYRGRTTNDTVWFPRSAPYFFNPKKFMHGMVLRDVKLYTSNTRPVGLVFLVSDAPVLADSDDKEKLCTRARVILKRDRLRQDQVCCEVAALLPRLMQGDAPRHRVLSYHVLPLTEDCGIVELLENAPNLQTVTNDEGKTLAELLKSQITAPDDARRTFFLDSVRFLVIIGSVLGLGDRHRSNIVLDKVQLQLCHIDFGRVLGDRTMFERADRVWNYLCGGGWNPKDIVVRFDDELAAAVDAMGEPPEVFIEKVARLIVDHVRPHVELLYLIMSRLREVLEDPNNHPQQQQQQPQHQQQQKGRHTIYSADSPYIGLLSHQRASAPRYDRAGQLIIAPSASGTTIAQARLLRERDHARTADAIYQYLHQCLRTSQNDQAVVLELCALLLPRNRVIQDKLHYFNQVALSRGGWVSYGLGCVSAVSSAAASSASGAASSWFGGTGQTDAAPSPPSSG